MRKFSLQNYLANYRVGFGWVCGYFYRRAFFGAAWFIETHATTTMVISGEGLLFFCPWGIRFGKTSSLLIVVVFWLQENLSSFPRKLWRRSWRPENLLSSEQNCEDHPAAFIQQTFSIFMSQKCAELMFIKKEMFFFEQQFFLENILILMRRSSCLFVVFLTVF